MLVIVDPDSGRTELRDGVITSFAWLSDTQVAYCARRVEGAIQRRVVCRRRLDGRQAELVAAFAQQLADHYSWQEHWAPSGQFVIFVEPALGGRFQAVNVAEASTRAVGRSGVYDCGVAWFADSNRALCVSKGVGSNGVYEVILLESGTGGVVDHSNEFQEMFGDRSPRLEPASTADSEYALVNCVVGGGYLVQPDPWRVIPLGQLLGAKPLLHKGSSNGLWLFQLPVPGCVGVLPTGNEEDSPIKYAAEYSGERVLALFESRGCWAVSPNGGMVATVGEGQRVELRDLGKWWISLIQP